MSSTTSLHRLIEDYLADGWARGLSPKTLKDAYGYPLLKVFLPWCVQQGLTEADQLNTRALTASPRICRTTAVAGASSRATRSRPTCGTSTGAGARARSATSGPLAEGARRVLDVLSRGEIDRLENAAGAERDKVILRLLADSGVRASELLGLRSEDLVERGRDRFIRVVGPSQGGGEKGDQGRLVPLQPPGVPSPPAPGAGPAGRRGG